MLSKKLTAACFFMAAAMTLHAQDKANDDQTTLVAEKVTVPTNSLYRIFIDNYGTALKDAVASGKKLAVRYYSEDQNIVEDWGNAFKVKNTGSVKVEMKIATVKEGTMEQFDPNNILDTKTIDVTVEENVPMPDPEISLTWGQSRQECIDSKTKNGKAVLSTDIYWAMTPNIPKEETERYEVFFNKGNYEFPVRMCYFNKEQDLLVTETLIMGSWERCFTTSSPIYQLLAMNGFEDRGVTEMNNWMLYNPSNETIATVGMMILQGSSYFYLTLVYADDPGQGDSIEEMHVADVNIRTVNNAIEVEAGKYAGELITVYDASGKILVQETALEGGNTFSADQMVIVKIGNCMPIKVMP